MNSSVLAVIPARAGSKRLPSKNLLPLAGYPLISYTIKAAKESKLIDRYIVTSDWCDVLNVAKQQGCSDTILRPDDLCGDDVSNAEVLIHALLTMKLDSGMTFDHVMLLHPTSPFRKVGDIDRMIAQHINARAKSTASVGPGQKRRFPAYFSGKNESELSLPEWTNGEPVVIARLNASAYLIRVNELLESRRFVLADADPFFMNEICCIDINSQLDYFFANHVIENWDLDSEQIIKMQ
jgi:CMP-N,N'-diacetyllegionaminic acid synthase